MEAPFDRLLVSITRKDVYLAANSPIEREQFSFGCVSLKLTVNLTFLIDDFLVKF